jgi:hypothetical protein
LKNIQDAAKEEALNPVICEDDLGTGIQKLDAHVDEDIIDSSAVFHDRSRSQTRRQGFCTNTIFWREY